MSERTKKCNCCGDEMTMLHGGLKCCPKCGFAGEPSKSDNFKSSTWSKGTFWILLIAPACLALASFLVGQASKNFGVGLGFVGLIIGAVASAYCGCWMAVRLDQNIFARILAGLFLISAIALVNFFIIFAGCAGNIQLH